MPDIIDSFSKLSLFDFDTNGIILNMVILTTRNYRNHRFRVVYLRTTEIKKMIKLMLKHYLVDLRALIMSYIGTFDSNIPISDYMVYYDFQYNKGKLIIPQYDGMFDFFNIIVDPKCDYFNIYSNTTYAESPVSENEVLRENIEHACTYECNSIIIPCFLQFFNTWIYYNKGITNFFNCTQANIYNVMKTQRYITQGQECYISKVKGAHCVYKATRIVKDPNTFWNILLLYKAIITSLLRYNLNVDTHNFFIYKN